MKIIYQKLWNSTKAQLGEKFIALTVYIKKEERAQINDFRFYLKKLKQKGQIRPKVSRRKEIQVKADISEIENSKAIQK